ncbi:popeye domain-containing protein 3 [Lingula anatina]|uniref:Popeye domain-containing protein 3 n=1 Tax=Lingula anatina TaxID=7574 RepID=A0A1S3HPZ6_LINAN|nr:popeye domain-containing protein 3 [Lingula anatina]|eukprot:XP_013388128.1 popeye domain-containing protein 3 [Lingula anatina]
MPTQNLATMKISFENTTDPSSYVIMGAVSNESLLDNISTTSWMGCEWLPPNHVYFQMANVCLLLSYLAPNGIYGLLFLRTVLCIASIFFSVWGWDVLCAFDTFLWNFFLAIINFVQAVLIIYHLRPLSFPPEIELMYEQLFKPLKVPRHLFKKAVDLHDGIFSVNKGELFATEGSTKTSGLSLLISGRMSVSITGKFAHEISEFQFLDSPEYVSFTEHDCFKVTIVALEDCRYIRWSKSRIKNALSKEPFLSAIFENVIGRDIASKLFMMNRHLLNSPLSLENLRAADLCTLEMEIVATCLDEITNEGDTGLQYKSLPTLAVLHGITHTERNVEEETALDSLLVSRPSTSTSFPVLNRKKSERDTAV